MGGGGGNTTASVWLLLVRQFSICVSYMLKSMVAFGEAHQYYSYLCIRPCMVYMHLHISCFCDHGMCGCMLWVKQFAFD